MMAKGLVPQRGAMKDMGGSIGELVGTLFLSREIAHRAHLKTTSFSEHKTLE